MITSKYVKVQGTKIYVESNNGPEENGTVLCFGSAGRESRVFHGIMEALENTLMVICFDMPGHGKSWPLPGNRCLEEYHEYGDFAIEVIEALKIKNPTCIGHALGGNIVLYLASRIPVKAVVSMAGNDYSPNVPKTTIDNLDHPYASVQHTHIDFTDSLIGSATTEENREFILWGVMTECGKVKRADYGGVYNGFDIRNDMDKITCPVLILRGAEDWTAHDDAMESMIGRLVNAKIVKYEILQGLSHYNPQEQPMLIANKITEILSECESEEGNTK